MLTLSKDLKLTQSFDQFILERIHELMQQDNSTLDEIVEIPFEHIGKHLDLDRISLFISEKNQQTFYRAYEWCHLGIEPSQTKHLIFSDPQSNAYYQQLDKRQIVIIEDTDDIDLIKVGINLLKDQPIKAFICFPIYTHQGLLGLLTMEHLRRQQTFESLKKPSFSLFTNMLAYRILPVVNDHSNEQKTNTTRFITNISHEVRTPLNALSNALYLLQTTDISKEQKAYLEMAQNAMDNILILVNRVLDLERIEKGQLELQTRSFDLEDEIIRMINTFRVPLEKKKLKLQFNYDYQIKHQVLGDARKMRQILAQIIENAIKFTDKGTITFTLSKSKPNIYLFEIIDTGIGISQEHMSRLDEAFYQVDMSDQKKYEGLGVGLTLVSELITFLNGRITIESKLGEGTKVSIELPFKSDQEIHYNSPKDLSILLYHDNIHQTKDMLESMDITYYDQQTIGDQKVDFILLASPLKEGETLSTIKKRYGKDTVLVYTLNVYGMKRIKKIDGTLDYPISRQVFIQKLSHAFHTKQQLQKTQYTKQLSGIALVVDDNRLNRLALERILNQLGIQSILAESGAKAIQIVKKQHVDMILMDVQMPSMDGFEATRRIRSLGNAMETVPIVAVTANAYFKDYDLLKTSKINDVIFKPIQVESLLQLLRKHLTSSEVIRIPDEIVIFDQHDFMLRFEGSYQIAQEVLETFSEEYQKDLENIRQAIAEENAERIHATTHYFKGSCSYLSAKRLVWLLSYMMEQAKLNQLNGMVEIYPILEDECKKMNKELENMKINKL